MDKDDDPELLEALRRSLEDSKTTKPPKKVQRSGTTQLKSGPEVMWANIRKACMEVLKGKRGQDPETLLQIREEVSAEDEPIFYASKLRLRVEAYHPRVEATLQELVFGNLLPEIVKAICHKFGKSWVISEGDKDPTFPLLSTIQCPANQELNITSWKIEPVDQTFQIFLEFDQENQWLDEQGAILQNAEPVLWSINKNTIISDLNVSTKISPEFEHPNTETAAYYNAHHKAHRYLYQFGGIDSVLDRDAIHRAFEEMRGCYKGEAILSHIEERFFKRLGMNSIMNVAPLKGLLLWGPPGTGKTYAIQNLSKRCGFQLLCEPCSPGEFGRGLQGQAQQVLLTYLNRMKTVPHLPCVLIIDEIDMLAPKREGQKEGSEGKVDLLNTVLTVFGGARSEEFPNLYVFGCTNLYNKMDEAFLRRMGAKIFVGKMSPVERGEYITESKCGVWDQDALELAKAVTCNFSGDNMKKFVETLKIFASDAKGFDENRHVYTFKHSRENIVDAAEQVCELERIYLGDHYLPTFFRSISTNLNASDFVKKCRDHLLTGRLFINLSCDEPGIFIQLMNDNAVVKHILTVPKKMKGMAMLNECQAQAIYLLVQLCTQLNPSIHTMQVINSSFLASKSILSEEDMQRFIFSLDQECHEYSSSLQVFCLDDLVNIRKNESNPDSKDMHHSVSYSIGRENLMENILNIFNKNGATAAMERPAHWTVILCKDQYLANLFKTKCLWGNSASETRAQQQETLNNTKRRCRFCRKMFTIAQNDVTECIRHQENVKLQFIDSQQQKPAGLNINVDLLPEAVAALARIELRQKYFWPCCGGNFYAQGCCENCHEV